MSEVKGTLLGIVLAISAFSIIFGIVMASLNKNSNSVAQRMTDASEVEPDVIIDDSNLYTLPH